MPRVIVLDKLAQEGLDILEMPPASNSRSARACRATACAKPWPSSKGPSAQRRQDHRRVVARQSSVTGDRPGRRRHRQHRQDAATRLGIVVMNTPTGNTLSTAEHTIAMMLAL